MIEIAMYIALGALAAGLIALAVIPAIWKRAVHLTQRRIEATVPLDVEEIRAEKDRMRAEFALTIRRIEKKLEGERDATTRRRIEINQQIEDLHSITAERDAKVDAIGELEDRERVLRVELRSREEELVHISGNLREAERKIVNRDNEIALLKGDKIAPESSFAFLTDVVRDAEADGVSIDDLDAKSIRQEYDATRREFEAATIRISTLENEIESTRAALDESNKTIEVFRSREADGITGSSLDAFAASDLGERKRLEAEIVELEVRRVENEAEITRLTIELENSGAALPQSDDQTIKAFQAGAQAQIQALKAEVAEVSRDRDRIVSDNAKLKNRLGEDGGAVEQENSALREKISELAANVAGMTAAIEGEGSQIIQLADDEVAGEDTSSTPNPTLAARIRKLAKETPNNGRKRH